MSAVSDRPAALPENPEQSTASRKRRRNACSPGKDGSPCVRCEEQGVQCTYSRPVKRRGPPSRRNRTDGGSLDDADSPRDPPSAENSVGLNDTSPPQDILNSENTRMRIRYDDNNISDLYSVYEGLIKPEIIESLVDVFYHASYPLSNWGLFIVTMAVCTVAAGRLHDGAVTPSDPHPLQAEAITIFSKCHEAALEAIPADITTVSNYYPLMKTKALLASAFLQKGELKRALVLGGDYIALSMSYGFQDEANWPSNLNEQERQERRRLFWGVYQHDQHMANSFGFVSRQREAKATVLYPAEVYDDSDITEYESHIRPDRVSYLRGWNFCTDLYRLLEHMDGLARVRQTPADEPGGVVASFLASRQPQKNFASDSLQLVSKLYESLPDDLRRINAMTGDPHQDRYGFIAANILLTTQNLKMVLVGGEKPNVHMRCAIVTELLDELSAIPLAFFHSSSTVTLHHLAQVGHMLAGVIQHPVSAWTYIQVRNILLVLAEFLTKIESNRLSSPGLAVKLRAQISRIDQCMEQMSQQNNDSGLLSIGQTLLSDWPSTVSLRSSKAPEHNSIQNHTQGNSAGPVPGGSNTNTALNNHRTHTLQDTQYQHQQTPTQQPSLANTFFPDTSDFFLGNIGNLLESPQPNPSFSSAHVPLNDPGIQSTSQYLLPNDLFDNWPFFLGQADSIP
ncbi:hypothetical protein N7528_005050 [Penicillium herquei]|nr:hypothetical protein N7528_005050 [Penicillium herquei]